MSAKDVDVIIAAGGRSTRYGAKNKLTEPCGASAVIAEAISPFLTLGEVGRVIVAAQKDALDDIKRVLSAYTADKRILFAEGGASRTETVKRALGLLREECRFVLIHDGARPYANTRLVAEVIAGARECGAALPLLAMTDAIVRTDAGIVPENRDIFRRVQTPAGFERERLVSAYGMADGDFFDDISVVQTYRPGDVAAIEGDPANIKITVASDLKTPLTGCGYDIHRMKNGDGIRLLGTLVACGHSFIAHSDGDVAVHALMDAILSALGKKDIGHYFPVDDPAYDGADSIELLRKVLNVMHDEGYRAANCAVAIIAEHPKIAPYIDEMKRNIADALSVSPDRVGVTATTNESVGEIGGGHAIAAYATVLLLPTA